MLELLTPPSTDHGPVALDDVKAYLRIEHADEDRQIIGWLRAATAAVETYTRRQLLNATWRQWYDAYPVAPSRFGKIRMFRPGRSPLIAVGSLQYLDPTDSTLSTWTTIAAADYRVDAIGEPGRIVEAPGVTWADPEDTTNSIRLQFDAGYGGSVPPEIEDAIRFYVAAKYRDRDEQMVPEAFYRMLDPFVAFGGDDADPP